MSLKNKFKLTSVALASAVAMGAMAMPTVASAEVGYSANISSMYLWRGQNISDGAPALSGDITYSHDSGFYAFGWMSSEGVSGTVSSSNTTTPATGDTDGGEVDVGIGYGGEVGPVGYDISYYKFWYPEEDKNNGTSFADAGAEYVIGLTYKPVTFKAYLDAKGSNDYSYYTLSASIASVDFLYGLSDSKTVDNDYSHFDVTFNATDSLSFTVSTPTSVDSGVSLDKDSIFKMSYNLPI